MNKIIYLFIICFISKDLYGQWELQAISPIGCLKEIEFTSETKGYIVGGNVIGTTDNAGVTWDWDLSMEGSFRIIDFINPDTALVCCFPDLGQDVMITYDGGSSWELPDLYVSVETEDMDLIPNGNIFLTVGSLFDGSYIFGTADFYTSTTSVLIISPSIPPFDIDFLTNEIGLVCGRLEAAEGTSVFKTVDGGDNWYTNENMNGPVYEMSFPSLNIGYGLGDESRVWKTIDGGESWNMLPFDFGGYDVVDENIALRKIYFYSDMIGYMEVVIIYPDFTEGIFIYRTDNGGESWYNTAIDYDEYHGINSIWCTSADTCYAVGCYQVYKTNNGGGIDTVTSIINKSDVIQFNISPNPATDFIKLFASKDIHIQNIYSYNLYGQAVKIEFDETGFADIANLNSGVYFTLITTNNGTQVRKWTKN